MNTGRTAISAALIDAARVLSQEVGQLTFAPPVSHIYNPLEYAWSPHESYLLRYGAGRKKIVFIGMNPGPFGMVQCGVPFGEIAAARDWMGIEAPVGKPERENPKRPVEGFACQRSEVSGRRLWGLFQQRFGSAEAFFAEHFVANYCPLVFFDQSRNLTPDKLGVVALDPDALSISGLHNYVKYLKSSGQDPGRYQLNMWSKIFQPLSVAVMMLMALSFIFGPLRSVPMGVRVVTGISFGFIFYVLDQIFGPLTLVYGIPPIIGALLPSASFFLISLWLMMRKA